MPTIQPSPLASPQSTSLFTGAIVLSRSPGGCSGFLTCTIVTFKDGNQLAGYSYSPFDTALRSIALPIDMPMGPLYYNQVAGDPAIILCDPSKLCGQMAFVGQIEASQTWSSFVTRQLAPVTDSAGRLSLQVLNLKAELSALQAENQRLQSRIEALLAEAQKQVAAEQAKASEVGPVQKVLRTLKVLPCPEPEYDTSAAETTKSLDSVATLLNGLTLEGCHFD